MVPSSPILIWAQPAARSPQPAARNSSFALWLLLTSLAGCSARTAPGEIFQAGYVFPDKQSEVVHRFVVRNPTSRSVKIKSVDKSCTCTNFRLGKYELAPGEKTMLIMGVQVAKSFQRRDASCLLRTDHPIFKNWTYRIQFTSLPFVVADPNDMDLGAFNADLERQNSTRKATLDFFADAKVELGRDNFSVPEELEFAISSGPEVRRLRGDIWNSRYQVSIGLSPKGREAVRTARKTEIITRAIQLTIGGSASRQWQYSVYWRTQVSLEAHPSYLNFGNLLDEKSDAHRRVLICSKSGKKFRILSIKTQPGEAKVEAEADSSEDAFQHWVKLKKPECGLVESDHSMDGDRRFLSGTIQIETTALRQPMVEVHWSAALGPTPARRARAGQSKSR